MRGFQPLEEEEGEAFGDDVIAEVRTKGTKRNWQTERKKRSVQACEQNTGQWVAFQSGLPQMRTQCERGGKERSFAGRNGRTRNWRRGGHGSASANGRKQKGNVEPKRAEAKKITGRTPRRARKQIRRTDQPMGSGGNANDSAPNNNLATRLEWQRWSAITCEVTALI